MKCFNLEKYLDLLLDEEISFSQKLLLDAHLESCENCRREAALQQAAQNLLKNQPPILPAENFDKLMQQTIADLHNGKDKTRANSLRKFFAFSSPIWRFSLVAGIFVIGLGLSFLFGRLSVAPSAANFPQPETAVSTPSKLTKRPPAIVEHEAPNKNIPAEAAQAKVIIKYIRVPVLKEKPVEKIIYVDRKNSSGNVYQTPNADESVAKQFNLKDLQPVATASYRIIRKGDNNE